MTLPTAFDRLLGSYYTDTSHYDAALKQFPDVSGMGFHLPLVQNSGTPTFNTRGSMPCLDLFPQGADPAYFQMPWTGYVDCSFIAAIRNKGTSITRSVIHAALNGDTIGEDYARTVERGDLIGSGQQVKTAVAWATTAALPANTYNNGASGVGATLTGNANGALPNQDTSVAPVVGQRGLVKTEAAGANNGIYTVTQVGDAGTPYILTRATDADSSSELSGAAVKVSAGTTLINHWFQLLVHVTHVIGTDAVTWRDVDTEFVQYDDAGFFISVAKNGVVQGWNSNGTSPNLAIADDTWTIVQGIWSGDGWRRIRSNLNAWSGTQMTTANRRIVTGGRVRLGFPVSGASIATVGEYCSIGELHFVSDDLFTSQTDTLDAVVTSMKTKYGIP